MKPNDALILLTPFKHEWMVVLEMCQKTCMTYTSAECTVEDSWWWAEEMPETRRVSWQNKSGKLVHLLVLLKRNKFGSWLGEWVVFKTHLWFCPFPQGKYLNYTSTARFILVQHAMQKQQWQTRQLPTNKNHTRYLIRSPRHGVLPVTEKVKKYNLRWIKFLTFLIYFFPFLPLTQLFDLQSLYL